MTKEPTEIKLVIQRRSNPKANPYFEEFLIPYFPKMNVVAALMEIQKKPVNAKGEVTTPVVWDCNCLEEVCGACTMVINGQARQACSALVDQLTQPIHLAPLSKFPVIKDLVVDRQVMFDNLRKVKAWIEIDGTHEMGPGPKVSQKVQEQAYTLSKCMTCGCCMEACPNVNDKSKFIGPAPIAQVDLMNSHPTGALQSEMRLEALMGEGGIADCGNAQNCIKACPKEIPLTRSIARLNRATTLQGIKSWFNK
ncbi:succinate dehydrogenase and fumarate reductase iron-sulfur protein [Desulfosporosinus orientis DSM 765]|uniref:succinate dehydrogenase n=1 Tax=Desulfosporosinus orientis (strain ATCC 19365 / DSM 765 / NCIMB 8382 / VKM B-1628 / Singapore I) TaxID=768706 RepID=G7WEY8_DESOD|nr:succinate dehydrogenase iron-sulfur subunit [Desulfosporosinus orientis]AET67317.1 succinate dehydrogenase and fumarate reductase iron-sulfur protein [Desulfosporosinus orientis DSM 765]